MNKFIATIIFAIPCLASARMGETEQQLVKRFGTPVARSREITLGQGKIIEFGDKLTFRQGDWTIEAAIIEGRCAREVYSKPGDWTEDQFLTVLTSNAQGSKWADVSKDLTKKLAREWRRDDAATAIWQMGTGMTVTNPAYARAKAKAEVKAKSEAARIPKI